MKQKKNREELARELYEHRHDPGEWSEGAVPIEVRPSRTSVVSFRLPTEDLDALEDAADAAGESISEYVRKAVALRLHNDALNGAKTNISYQAPEKDDAWQNWSTASASAEVRSARS